MMILVATLTSLAFAFGVLYVVPELVRRAQRAGLRGRCRRAGALVLTYDDGPSQTVTPALLEVLARHGVRATFFAQGCNADRLPHLLEKMRSEGHEVGGHGQEHVHTWRAGPIRAFRDTRQGLAAVATWTGDRPLFRPPYGKVDALTWAFLRIRGIRIAWWTHDSRDTKTPLPSPANVVAELVEDGGGVVLLHDSERSAEFGAYVLDLTRLLIEAAEPAGLRVMLLGDVLSDEGVRP